MTMTRQTFPPRLRRFTPGEYHRMADDGYFENQHVELIDGEIIEMSPQNEPHVGAISRLIRLFYSLRYAEHELRCQAPLSIGNSEPEPDIAIIQLPKPKGTHPTTALLVIEVADSSLAIDRKKAHLYASAQIPEYWLLNLATRTLERHTTPVLDATSPFAAKYATITHHPPADSLTPLALQIPSVQVASLFEPAE